MAILSDLSPVLYTHPDTNLILCKPVNMRPAKDQSKRRPRPHSPPKSPRTTTFSSGRHPSPPRSGHAPSARAVVERDLTTEQDSVAALFEDLQISPPISEPRSFPYSVKQQCWEKAEKVKGRDPNRWRKDPLGNIVFRKLVGCPGCLCYDYDHIVPYSKGGKSTLDNCQVLQATVNRSKGNRMELSRADLIQRSSYCRVSGRDMDMIESSAYGNVRHAQDSGGCRIQ